MSESTKERPCITCQYHREYADLFHVCDNPQYEIEDYNYITGKRRYIAPSCYDLRDKNGKCGYEGNGWIYKGIEIEEYEPIFFMIKRKIKQFSEFIGIIKTND